MNVFKSAMTGEYAPVGDPQKADCVIGQSFGASEHGPGYVNELLAKYIVDNVCTNVPLILQNEIAAAMPNNRKPVFSIEGAPSTLTGGGLNSLAAIEQANIYMKENGLEQPLFIAQAYHIGRVAMLATNLGINPIIPENLPTEFDPESTQIWTRNKYLWIPRELAVISYLKAKQKLRL